MSPLPKLAPLARAVDPEVVVDNLEAHPPVFVPRVAFAAYLMASLQRHETPEHPQKELYQRYDKLQSKF